MRSSIEGEGEGLGEGIGEWEGEAEGCGEGEGEAETEMAGVLMSFNSAEKPDSMTALARALKAGISTPLARLWMGLVGSSTKGCSVKT